jgi:hypothetical protein
MSGRSWRRTGSLALAAVLAGSSACSEVSDVGPSSPATHHAVAAITPDQARAVEGVLAELRRLTQPYRNFEVAKAAGYGAQLTGCMESPPVGGMGFHYGKPSLIDGTVEPLKPEILMYEPQRNGDLLFVGVEYVVPFTAWTSPLPPNLAGVAFHRNEAFGLWVLHAWIGKANPSGVLTDWNPRVTCQYAAPNRS